MDTEEEEEEARGLFAGAVEVVVVEAEAETEAEAGAGAAPAVASPSLPLLFAFLGVAPLGSLSLAILRLTSNKDISLTTWGEGGWLLRASMALELASAISPHLFKLLASKHHTLNTSTTGWWEPARVGMALRASSHFALSLLLAREALK